MNSFLISTGAVALAEMGDKTQLLSLVLAARFRRPLPILLGILVATLANHAGAGALGTWLTHVAGRELLRWGLGLSFIAMAIWTLIPDRPGATSTATRFGVFGTTVLAFFVAEMGDKTQVATVMLAARYAEFAPVVLGTTVGMLLANAPVVIFGEWLTQRIPLRAIRSVAAALFVVLGVMVLVG